MTNTTYSNTTKSILIGSVAVLSALAFAAPASAEHRSSSDVYVGNSNSAVVVNEVQVVADTGYNTSVGGNSGSAGRGGDATGQNALGGEGGDSGNGGYGGDVTTGDATAIGTVNNDVNSNRTVVTRDCDCDDRKRGDTVVEKYNQGAVANGLLVDARTGENMVLGGTSGSAGVGGKATSRPWKLWGTYYLDYYNESSDEDGYFVESGAEGGETYAEVGGYAEGGAGGNSGDAGSAGSVQTGNSISDGLVVNVVNRNVTRVAR